MPVTRFPNAAAFQAAAGPYLIEHETEHNLMLGLVSLMAHNPDHYGQAPYFAAVSNPAGHVVAAAVMTPPHQLCLSLIADPDALPQLVEDVYDFRPDLPGVTGVVPVGLQFAEAWHTRTGRLYQRSMAERLYRLDTVQPPHGVPGRMRRVTPHDQDLLQDWIKAFQDEAFGRSDAASVDRTVQSMLTLPSDLRGTFVWEDPQPVCLVSHGGRTPHSMRIGPVFTPREHRGHGYASALTAAVSQLLLDAGYAFCTLFTDLANPTSNKIYQAIGYWPVSDVDEYRFDSRSAG